MEQNSEEIKAEVGELVVGARPEPPKCPTMYGVRWQSWSDRCGEWIAIADGSDEDISHAQRSAQRLITEGARNVRIYTIPGD